jgi:signal transduction histidine kinase
MVARQPDPDGAAWAILDDLPLAVLQVDPTADRILRANVAAAELVCCTPLDLVALPLSRALVGEDNRAELRVGDRIVPVTVVRSPGASTRDGPTTLILLDRVQLTLATLDDVELRGETERMRNQLDGFRTGQERLVSVWAHELKTPLTVVLSYLEILTTELDEGLSEEQLSFLRITRESVMRLRRLVLDLVDLIGFRSGHLSIEPTTVDVAALLETVTGELAPLAQAAGIELVHERPAVRIAIRADSDRVGQILRNLLDNALKFTAEGGRVLVRTRVEREWVIVDVVDTGVGIQPGDLERVFEDFVQIEGDAPRRRQRGSGIGLAISRRIAEAHGGAIEVQSEPGRGSVFSVRLPREHEDEMT